MGCVGLLSISAGQSFALSCLASLSRQRCRPPQGPRIKRSTRTEQKNCRGRRPTSKAGNHLEGYDARSHSDLYARSPHRRCRSGRVLLVAVGFHARQLGRCCCRRERRKKIRQMLLREQAQTAKDALTVARRPYVFISGVKLLKLRLDPLMRVKDRHCRIHCRKFRQYPCYSERDRIDFLSSKKVPIDAPDVAWDNLPIFDCRGD